MLPIPSSAPPLSSSPCSSPSPPCTSDAATPAPSTITNRTAQIPPGSPLYLRYVQAQALLNTPVIDGRSLQQALLDLLHTGAVGDVALPLLVSSHLPWGRVHALMGDPEAQLAPHTLALLLHGLFAPDDAQGALLLPLLKQYGRTHSLAQWVAALAQPRAERHGTLMLRPLGSADDATALAARLAALPPVAELDEETAAHLLLNTLLPGWGSEHHDALLALWREDREGWSLLDAAVRAGELTDGGRVRIADALTALLRERDEQRPPPDPAGNVAEALVGLLNHLCAGDPKAVADRVMARLQLTVPQNIVVAPTPGRVVEQRLRVMDERDQWLAGRKAFHRAALQDMIAQRLQEGTATEPLIVPEVVRANATRSAQAEATDALDVPVGSALLHGWDSPGRLTALGMPDASALVVPPFGMGAAAATLRPIPRLIDPAQQGSITLSPSTTAATAAPKSADELRIEREIEKIQAQLPAWLTQAPADQQDYLKALIGLQESWEDQLMLAMAQVASLPTYSRDVLAQALNRTFPGQGISPEAVNVTVIVREWPVPDIPGDLLDLPGAWPVPKEGVEPVLTTQTLPLVAFAVRNTAPGWLLGPDHFLSAQWTDTNGTAQLLDSKEIERLVREVDIGRHYPRYLRDQLLWPLAPHAGTLHEAWIQSNRAGLEAALHAARVQGRLFTPNYFDDVRGWDIVSRMIEHVIDYPDAQTRPMLDHRHHVEVHALTIGYPPSILGPLLQQPDACVVNGVWWVQMRHPEQGITAVVVITPGAPDGKFYRVYENLRDAQSDPYWLTPAGYDFLKQKMSVDDQRRVDGLAFGTDPVKSRGGTDPRYFTADKLQPARIDGDFLQAAYEQMAERMIADGAAASTTTAEVDWWAALSFSFDQLLMLGDLTTMVPLPLLRLMGKLKLLRRPAELIENGRGLLKAGDDLLRPDMLLSQRKPPFARIVKLEDGRIGVLAGPVRPPNWEALKGLQEQVEALLLKARSPGKLSPPEEVQLRRLSAEVPALKAGYVRQYSHEIDTHRATWWPMMDAAPTLAALTDTGRAQYVAYLLSLRRVDEVTSMLRFLQGKEIATAPVTYRSLHERAMALIDSGARGAPVAGPAPKPQAPSAPVPESPSKRKSDEVAQGSPRKRLSGSLEGMGAVTPPKSAFTYMELPRSRWPAFLYHYTSEAKYHTILNEGWLNPSNADPVGRVGAGPAPSIVYVTTMPPTAGRAALAPALFGTALYHKDRTDKVARAIKLASRHLPEGSRLFQYTDKSHSQVLALSTPASGYIRLKAPADEPSILVRPVDGEDIVPA